ncbi:TetR/AcrR family transcriptional regulator [Bacillus salipaludis]|uniref:TetR/AcrR family transcriptional regulator n=1 Tax=Bacillus salipaludis TaxID=2547811 RepID=UPI002E1CCC3C|nr:TetR/AcrR family transcriptional regulator [Bacillus salipaludis]
MTKNKIKKIASKQLAEKGYEQATLSSIAKEVGIKTPSIYAFFKNKEDLFMTVYRDMLEDYYQYIQHSIEQVTAGNVKEKLYRILQELSHYHLSQPEKTQSYMRLALSFPPTFNQEVKDTFNELEQHLCEILHEIFLDGINKREIKNQPLDDLVASFLCVMDGVFLELIYYPEDKYRKRLEQVWNVYWLGISTPLNQN